MPALDLATPAWHEPPDAEAVNAATYALRRAVNAYPDPTPLREALAARHGVARDQVAPGHGAGELLHSAFRALAAGGEVAVAWPGWGPLPRLVHEGGGAPVPVPLTADGAPDADGAGRRGRPGHARGRAVHPERPDGSGGGAVRAARAGGPPRRAGVAGRRRRAGRVRARTSRTTPPPSCSTRASV